MICNCSSPDCQHNSSALISSNELAFDISLLDVMEMFLGYTIKAIDPINATSQLNYSAVVIKNLINHLKVLTLSSGESIIEDNGECSIQSEWDTCNETFSGNYIKLIRNFRLENNKRHRWISFLILNKFLIILSDWKEHFFFYIVGYINNLFHPKKRFSAQA